jgi:HSP20 family protein
MASNLTRLMHSLMRSTLESYQHGVWQPAADVYRTAGGWLVKFDLAGVRPEDIEVEICGSLLTIRGARRDWMVEEGHRAYSLEISYSRFQKSVQLPCELEGASLRCQSRDGMLLVQLTTQ